MPKPRRSRSRSPLKPLRSRNRGKTVCKPFGKLTLCAIGNRYGFEVRLYPIGAKDLAKSTYLPVHVPGGQARTAGAALTKGAAWLRTRKR